MDAQRRTSGPSPLDAAVPSDVSRWLGREALPGARIVGARPLTGGFSNDNLLLATDAGEQFVLRRYPRGNNTCAVEAALARRLASTGAVPVADVVAADPEGAAAGEPVMVSRFVDGELVSAVLPGLDAHGAKHLGRAVGAVLAAIGAVAFPRPGFFDGPDLVPGPEGMEPTAELPAFVDRCLRTGNAHLALSAAEQDALRGWAAEAATVLDAVRGARRLVHSDFNPKNLLAAARADGTWTVTAVLDWEFAFSSSPLFDVGNMLRFRAELPPPYADGFVDGYGAAGGHLPDDWPTLSTALDLFALADFLTRPPDHPFFGKAVARIRELLAGDDSGR